MSFSHWTHGSFVMTLDSEGNLILRRANGERNTHTQPPLDGPAGRTARQPRDRAARRSLAGDLATYTSASDLNDLDAILDRYSDEDTADIRRILASRSVA
jgi:hypothetical protein